jgi:hypothetical protein
MIEKDRNPDEHHETGRMAAAGEKAEKQMAFYLKRAFQDDKNIWVFNDLRFQDDEGDAAQIDHLILHRHGFVIIESKSVTTKVRVNEQHEWSRQWNGWQGMPSPIQQAKRQTQFLRRGLNVYCEELVGKVFGFKQMKFNACPFDLLIAISDSGTIERETEVPEVVKADQVCDNILAIYQRHRKSRSALNIAAVLDFKSDDGIYNFKDEEMARISDWLTSHHHPRVEALTMKPPCVKEEQEAYGATTPPPLPTAEPQSIPSQAKGICNKCQTQSEILSGRYGYYWKCHNCATNTAIKIFCDQCEAKMKIRKSKKLFYLHCKPCTTESLYHSAD